MVRIKTYTLVLLVAYHIPAASGAAPAKTPRADETPTPEQIQRWIDDLDHELYLVRERATENLARAGQAALTSLAKAADDRNLEVATRSVRLLMKLADSEDTTQAVAALKQLAALKNRPVERAAAEAILHGMRERLAMAEIERLGGEQRSQYMVDGQRVTVQLKIGENWKGGDEGLKHLKELKMLQILEIHGTPVTDKGVKHLEQITSLTHVQLYGTNVTPQAADELRKALPHAEVHHRQGALLGVGGIAHPQGAEITQVQPDSAAFAAGIIANDVITKFNGKPVGSFEGLTTFIAKCKPGDEATLEILRGEAKMIKKVTFGKWR